MRVVNGGFPWDTSSSRGMFSVAVCKKAPQGFQSEVSREPTAVMGKLLYCGKAMLHIFNEVA
jgi:hypothetical protein